MVLDQSTGYGAFAPGGEGFETLSADGVLRSREIYQAIFSNIDDLSYVRRGFSYYLELLGGGLEATTDLIYHTEEGSMYRPFTVAAKSGGATPGSDITITFSASDLDLINGKYYPGFTPGMMVHNVKNTAIRFRVKTVGAADSNPTITMVLSPDQDSAVNTTNLIAVSDVFAPAGKASNATAAFGAEGMTRGWERYSITWSEIETATPEHVGADYNQSFDINVGGGKTYLAYKYMTEALAQHEIDKGRTMVYSDGKSYDGISTTMGALPVAKAFGTTINASPGSWAYSDLLTLIDSMKNRNAGDETIQFLCGFKWVNRLQEVVGTNFQNGAILFSSVDPGVSSKIADQRSVSLGVKSFTIGTSTAVFKTMTEFEDVNTALGVKDGVSVVGAELPYSALVMPTTGRNIGDNETAATTTPIMRVRYKTQPEGPYGTNVRIRQYNFTPVQLGREAYRVRLVENIALQVMGAKKLTWWSGKSV